MTSAVPGQTRTWLPAEPPSRDLAIARATVTESGAEEAVSRIRSWPGYAPTPLRPLADFARETGVDAVLYKDEGERFGAGNFKVLGAAYAAEAALAVRDAAGDVAAAPVLCCASAGNHGRALAWAARRFGVRAVVFLPEHARPERRRRIRALGAEVVDVDGPYDAAVTAARREAAQRGWILVSDTLEPGSTTGSGDRNSRSDGSVETARTRQVMQGYAVIVDEVLEQLDQRGASALGASRALPTHVFLQAGVGTFAAAIAARLGHRLGARAPRIVIVEPATSCGVLRFLAETDLRDDDAPQSSMDCLVAGHVSVLARPILRAWSSAAIAIDEDACARTFDRLPPGISAGPSGVAGLAGFASLVSEPRLRGRLGLDPDSIVLTVGTEESAAPA